MLRDSPVTTLPAHPIRLLVADLDGTLLDARGRVSPGNAAAVRRAREAGIEVVVATGRSWLESRTTLEAIGCEGLMIAAGGATLHDSRTGRILARRTVEPHLVERICGSLIRHGHLAHLLQDPEATGRDYTLIGEARLDPASEWWFSVHPVSIRRCRTVEEARPLGATIRAGTVAVAEELEAVATELRDDLGDLVHLQHWSAQTPNEAIGSRIHLLEIFARETNKWTMIEDVLTLRGHAPHEVAAVGDGLNDLQMIGRAGLGIAMGNADPRIAAAARVAVGHHDRDGFAEAVDLILRAHRGEPAP